MLGFAIRLRELRQQQGLTQAELATRANLSPQGIYALERGSSRPLLETVMKLAKALGVEPAQLMNPTKELTKS